MGHTRHPADKNLFCMQENSEEEIMPVSVTCGSHHTAVITRRGDLISWGMGTSGQTGHGPTVGDVCAFVFYLNGLYV
jgi:alpha-tubulin suppressor-like RCC1 family protein